MERINEFYSTLKRGNFIQSDLDSLLCSIRPNTDEFKLLYRLIAHTRDITNGLGERDLTYAIYVDMLCGQRTLTPIRLLTLRLVF